MRTKLRNEQEFFIKIHINLVESMYTTNHLYMSGNMIVIIWKHVAKHKGT
mgnify:CR=1 FL=1